jgi:hypothetical protein
MSKKLPIKYQQYIPYLKSIEEGTTYLNFEHFLGLPGVVVKVFNKEFKIPKGYISMYDLENYIWGDDTALVSVKEIWVDNFKHEEFLNLQQFKVIFEEHGEYITLLYLKDDEMVLTLAIKGKPWYNITEEKYKEALKLEPEIKKYLK